MKNKVTSILDMYKKKRGLSSLALVLALILVGGVLVSCNRNTISPEAQSNPEEGTFQIANLYAHKTAYIGDNSKVGDLIAALPTVEDMTSGEFSLDTRQEGLYSVTINYTADGEIIQIDDAQLLKNAILMLSLIGNCDKIYMDIQISVKISPDLPTINTVINRLYTRQDVEKLFDNKDVRAYAEDYDTFAAFYSELINILNMEIVDYVPNTIYIARSQEIYKVIPSNTQILVLSDYNEFVVWNQDFRQESWLDEQAIQSSLGRDLNIYEGKMLYVVGYTVGTADTSNQPYTSSPYVFLFDRDVLLGYQNLETYEKDMQVIQYLSKIKTVNQRLRAYFANFYSGSYQNMESLSTTEHIQRDFTADGVYGIKTAKCETDVMEGKVTYLNGSSPDNATSAQVKYTVIIDPVPGSKFDGIEKIDLMIHLVRDADGPWLVDKLE